MDENSEISLTEPDKADDSPPSEPEVVQLNGDVKESEDWKQQLEEFRITISHLKDEVTKKTSVISDLEKQRGSLEKEVTHVSNYM